MDLVIVVCFWSLLFVLFCIGEWIQGKMEEKQGIRSMATWGFNFEKHITRK